MPSVASVLDEHVDLQLRCVDRLYLNGYLPGMQVGNQLKWFLIRQRGCAVPSPAVLGEMGKTFRAKVEAFAEQEGVPLIEFERRTIGAFEVRIHHYLVANIETRHAGAGLCHHADRFVPKIEVIGDWQRGWRDGWIRVDEEQQKV